MEILFLFGAALFFFGWLLYYLGGCVRSNNLQVYAELRKWAEEELPKSAKEIDGEDR